MAPPECEGVCQSFDAWLAGRDVYWPVSVQAGATALVPWIMAGENSVGLCVAVRALQREGLRAIPLPVAPLTVGAIWRGPLTPTLKRMLELIARCAEEYQRRVVNGT